MVRKETPARVARLKPRVRLDFAALIGYKLLMSHCHRLLSLALVAALLFTGCNSALVQRAARAAGEEAAYVALEGYLTKAGITSADHMVDALRMVVKSQDYPGAAAAFAVALAEHNSRAAEKLTSAQVISLLRRAQPVVGKASPRVATYLGSFCDYVAVP